MDKLGVGAKINNYFEPAWTQTVYQIVTRSSDKQRAIVSVKFYGDPDREISYLSITNATVFLLKTHVIQSSLGMGNSPSSMGAISLDTLFNSCNPDDMTFLDTLWPLIYRNHGVSAPYDTVEKFWDFVVMKPFTSVVLPTVGTGKAEDAVNVVRIDDSGFDKYDIGFDTAFRREGYKMLAGKGSKHSFGAILVSHDLLRRFLNDLQAKFPNVRNAMSTKLSLRFTETNDYGTCYCDCKQTKYQFDFRYTLATSRWLVLAKAFVTFAESVCPMDKLKPKFVPETRLVVDVPMETFHGDVSEAVTIATQ